MYETEVCGVTVRIGSSEGLFSPRKADRGTLAMLRACNLQPGMKVLDLGCGCGIVGICAALRCGEENVTACDIDPKAVEAAKENAAMNGVCLNTVVSDGLSGVKESGFDLILSNPPYQSDFAVAKKFIEKGFNRLKPGGILMMVTKRRPWYENKLRAVFGGCRVMEDDGYFVFIAERRSAARGGKDEKKRDA